MPTVKKLNRFRDRIKEPKIILLMAILVGFAGVGGYALMITNANTAMTTVSVNDSTEGTGDAQFQFLGTWGKAVTTGAFKNDEHYSNTAGATYTVKFTGTQVKVYSMKNPNYGQAAYSVDGGPETTFDHYASTRQFSVLAYSSPTLTNTSHYLRVRILGTKSAASSGAYVAADRVDIIKPVPPTGTTVTLLDAFSDHSSVNQAPYSKNMTIISDAPLWGSTTPIRVIKMTEGGGISFGGKGGMQTVNPVSSYFCYMLRAETTAATVQLVGPSGFTKTVTLKGLNDPTLPSKQTTSWQQECIDQSTTTASTWPTYAVTHVSGGSVLVYNMSTYGRYAQ